jgi:hypothetical protein
MPKSNRPRSRLSERDAAKTGMTRTISPGTIVKMKGAVWGLLSRSPAIMLKHDGSSVRVLADMGVGHATRQEVSVPAFPLPTFEPMRLRLVYGVWTEHTGSKVFFSRDYMPLWRVSTAAHVTAADPWEWIDFAEQEHWWEDATTPWGDPRRARQVETRMSNLGLTGRPRLLGVVDVLINERAENIRAAVRSMVPAGQPVHHL